MNELFLIRLLLYKKVVNKRKVHHPLQVFNLNMKKKIQKMKSYKN